MIRGDLASPMRRKVIGVACLFAIGAGFAIWLGLIGVTPFVREVTRRAPLVAFRPSDLIPLPLAFSLSAFSMMCLIPVLLICAES